jgi:hypothetical protein
MRLTHAETVPAQDVSSTGTVGLLVRLTFEDETSRSGVCTGVVAARNLVLTAAHCFTDPRRGKVAEIGGHVSTGPLIEFHGENAGLPILRAALHPEWNGWFHDVALVVVGQDIPDSYMSVSFVREVNEAMNGQAVNLFGYGISADGRSDSGTLRKAESAILNVINRQNYPKSVLENQVRIQSMGIDKAQACTGDSGGPAFLKATGGLLGLVSGMNVTIQQTLDCRSGDVNYTLIQPYLDWIQKVSGVVLNSSAQPIAAKDLARAVIADADANAIGFVVRPTQAMLEQSRSQQTTSFETTNTQDDDCQ